MIVHLNWVWQSVLCVDGTVTSSAGEGIHAVVAVSHAGCWPSSFILDWYSNLEQSSEGLVSHSPSNGSWRYLH